MSDAPAHPRRLLEAAGATAAFVVLTIVMTWPIARGVTRDVPADLGDALLNMWIMAWVSESLVAMATGTMSFADLWNANIFHPTPLALTLSEHLVPQALQGLPFYLTTGNIVLAYNVVFLTTFVLSGLGMFLLVRELTGSSRAAFVAGVFFAFVPCRLGSFPHIQTLSTQWMPLTLYGLRRFLDRGHVSALIGATVAFVLQGLSSGYFLFFFAPVVLMYVVGELAARGRMRDGRAWIWLTGAGLGAVACMLPFLWPYLEAKRLLGLTRSYQEVLAFSANLFAYVNASPQLHFWGPWLNKYPEAEGDLFMGVVPMLLGAGSVLLWVLRARQSTRGIPTPEPRRRWLRGLLILAGTAAVAGLLIALTGGAAARPWGITVTATSPTRPLMVAVLAGLVWLGASPRGRAAVRRLSTDATPILALAFIFAVWMSLGPEPRAGARALGDVGPYYAFQQLVPGFDGLRVPARFAMVAACLLAALSGLALAALDRIRFGVVAVSVSGLLFLGEAYAVPHAVNVSWRSGERYADPWPMVHPLNDGPLAYRHVLAMPHDTVLVELPLGEPSWDIRYVFYAGLHGKRIANGYSGYEPPGYATLTARLARYRTTPAEAWTALRQTGATHVLLHDDAYPNGESRDVADWIERSGGRVLVHFDDGARLYEVPRPSGSAN